MWARDGFIPHIQMFGYPWRSCYQGDLDPCGFRRPQSYFREVVWIGNTEPRIFTTHPEHYGEGFSGTGWHWYDVHEDWTFDDKYIGRPVRCEVCTDAYRIGETGAELLRGHGAVPVVIDEYYHDTWSHGKNFFTDEIAKFADAEVTVLESGPVRATVKVVSR